MRHEKRKMFKKMTALMLVLMMITSVFAGCGQKSKEVTPAPVNQNEEKVTTRPVKDDPEKGTGDDMVSVLKTISTLKDSEFADTADALKAFSYDLFKQTVSDENPVVSPLSAYLALAMAGAGADGDTKEEFDKIFGKDFLSVAKYLYETYNVNTDNLKVSTANAAWLSNKIKTEKDWKDALNKYFNAEVSEENLTKAKVVKDINKWVNKNTNGLIEKMVDEPFSEFVRFVLFNAIYFKGQWVNEFDEAGTYEQEFKKDGKVSYVDMMHLYGETFSYIANDDCTGAILPYKDGDLAMIALKPNAGTSARDLLSKVDPAYINEILTNRRFETLNLALPKFELGFERELNDDLRAVGFDKIFTGAADFSKASKDEDFYISLVKQKAKIIVDEKGTEAAAVTEVRMECQSAAPATEPIEMFFDEPFVYMIIDTDNQVPLFMGILDDPNAAK
ncbi:MAG: serpin family protein [Lachnospiraceae bacterium]|nr:serpin family protein [Lachnospiraceae bacterium]